MIRVHPQGQQQQQLRELDVDQIREMVSFASEEACVDIGKRINLNQFLYIQRILAPNLANSRKLEVIKANLPLSVFSLIK